ncbi:MAG: hypothetical protein QUV06_13480 [Cyanobium sp. CZS 48M]|nr:hypothetical protein [Cyanobium sp. CZS48M]
MSSTNSRPWRERRLRETPLGITRKAPSWLSARRRRLRWCCPSVALLRSRGATLGRPSPWQISWGRGLARRFQLGIATTLSPRREAGRVAARQLARQGIA